MISQEIKIKNVITGEEITLNKRIGNEVIALQVYPAFITNIRNQQMNKMGRDGEYILPQFYGGKSINFEGSMVADSEKDVWKLKKSFEDVLKISDNKVHEVQYGDILVKTKHNIEISFTNPLGHNVVIYASVITPLVTDRAIGYLPMLNFQVQLRANNPYFFVDNVLTVTDGEFGKDLQGFKIPFQSPFIILSEQQEGLMSIVAEDDGLAVITLNGSDDGVIVNPRIKNLTTGDEMMILKGLANANSYFKIDAVNTLITDENGTDITAFGIGSFIRVKKGLNHLLYYA